MTTVCLHVKPTASDPGIGLMSVTLLGPKWSGERLRLTHWAQCGLAQSDLVGWSDFYGGGACPVQVAYASDGRRTGFLVWGGNLGLRNISPQLSELNRQMGKVLESRSVIWMDDSSALPADVREVVDVRVEQSTPGHGVQPNESRGLVIGVEY